MPSQSGSTCRRRKCFTMRKIKVKPMENPKSPGKEESRTCEFLEDEHLTLDDHGHVLTAVLSNDVIRLQKIINEATSEEKAALVSRHYTFTDLSISHVTHRQGLHLRLLVAVAVALGYWQIVEVLLKEGVDVLQQDCFGNNVIHSLVMQAFYHPQLEETLVDNFHRFIKLLRPEKVKTLLMSENMYKVRAVEFAAQHGACRMVLAIMNVPGVHLYKVQSFGTVTYKWYDVTEYETASRSKKSPLLFLTFADRQTVRSASFHELHKKSLFTKWFDVKFKSNLPYVIVWFVLKLCYVTCYFVYDMDVGWYVNDDNATRCDPTYGVRMDKLSNYAISMFLLTFSAGIIVVDVWDTIRFCRSAEWNWLNTVNGRRVVPNSDAFFRLCNTASALFISTEIILNFCFYEYLNFYNIARVICPSLAIWGLLYFVQIVPSVGHFVITIQAMLGDLFNFSIIFIIMMIPFMHSFQVIVNSNTNIGCFGEYDTLFQTFYSLFRVMLNMLDLTAYDINNLGILLFAHVVYTFTVSIMMINFFIALLSDSVSRISQSRHVTISTRRSLMAFMVENRYAFILKRFHRWMKSRYFLYEDDRIFLVESESVLD